MSEVTVLLVESRRTATATLAIAIEKAGYATEVVHTGRDALALSAVRPPALIVFDARAMRSNGSRSCRQLRQQLPDVPIIHCREAQAEHDESAEANIYLKHPFTPRKVVNRIRKLLPATDSESQIVRFEDVTLYTGKRSVQVADRLEQALTPKMLALLLEFMAQPDRIISRRELMQRVWKTDYVGDTRTLDVHIRWLREVLEEDASQPTRLLTVRGKGYRLRSRL